MYFLVTLTPNPNMLIKGIILRLESNRNRLLWISMESMETAERQLCDGDIRNVRPLCAR